MKRPVNIIIVEWHPLIIIATVKRTAQKPRQYAIHAASAALRALDSLTYQQTVTHHLTAWRFPSVSYLPK